MPDLLPSPQHPSPLDRYIPRTVAGPESEHPAVMAVMAGKRYVIYSYVASMLILTFRRNMGSVRIIETGQWPMGPLFGATVITTVFGWWGFPWGIIWSPMASRRHQGHPGRCRRRTGGQARPVHRSQAETTRGDLAGAAGDPHPRADFRNDHCSDRQFMKFLENRQHAVLITGCRSSCY